MRQSLPKEAASETIRSLGDVRHPRRRARSTPIGVGECAVRPQWNFRQALGSDVIPELDVELAKT